MSGLGFIAPEPDGECELCGVVDELSGMSKLRKDLF
jgi:hypothetical protein